ncbi:MAG: type II secretion system protein M [Uliginosibacterium sp.]|nr:type II secretion system protein M [Uliginosibacterium sp.]MBK9392900.1 type II secretion system protein M [Uliginosibacterium sp.]MBK9614741.1 type II secretion system protein M [Uliginosibacterium sp.]
MASIVKESLLPLVRKHYATRPLREKRLILAMCAVIGAGILWACFSWQSKENTRLDRSLPQARARLSSLQDAAAEITRLRAQAKPAPAPMTQLLDTLNASARAQQLNVTIRSVDSGTVQVSGSGVNFDTWIAWAADLHLTQGLQLTTADIAPEAKGVRIEAQFSAAR